MKTVLLRFVQVLCLWLFTSVCADAQTRNVQNDYTVSSSPYSYVPVSSSNSATLLDIASQGVTGGLDDGYYELDLPFPFSFNGDGSTTRVRVNTNGSLQIARASGVIVDLTDGFKNMYGYPGQQGTNYLNNAWANMVFGWGVDVDMTVGSPGWFYAIQGTAPNRRAVFEWRAVRIWDQETELTFQIVLNEGSKAIDVLFGPITNDLPSTDSYDFYTGLNEGTAAVSSVGLSAKSIDNEDGNFIGSSYDGSDWRHSSTAVQPDIYTSSVFPTGHGLRYCYLPNIGSATDMVLFDAENNADDRIDVGAVLTKQYTVTNPTTADAPMKITAQIVGSGAGAYSVTPASVASLAPGASQTFSVKFAPTTFGDFEAEMDVYVSTVDGMTCPLERKPAVVTLYGTVPGLTAQIDPLVIDFGEVGINATASQNVAVFKNESSSPLVYYFNGAGLAAQSYQLVGATGNPPILSGTVAPGQYVYLPVSFNPTVAGIRNATVNFYYTNQSGTARSLDQAIGLTGAGTPSRLKLTRGNSTAHFASGGVFAQSVFGAVGEEPLSFDFTVSNTGQGAPLHLYDFQFYDLDRENPVDGRLRVMWTGGFGSGTPIPSNDFRVQQLLNGEWVTVDADDAVTVPAQQSQQMRVQFVPDRRAINFVRMFFRTDATIDENFNAISALNTGDASTTGLQSYDFYGITARNSEVSVPASLLFEPVEIGKSSTATITIRNMGNSRLLIEQSTLHLISGDKDFTIESAFEGLSVDNGRYVIPVEQTGTIVIRFTPRANGTRLSTLVLTSNDSSVVNGIAGVRYIPITGIGVGKGQINVFAVGTDTNPFGRDTAIVAVPETYREADIEIRNTGNVELQIIDVMLRGLNEADYSFVTPVDPMNLAVGQSKMVRVRFAPQTGGQKVAELVVSSSAQNGDQIVQLRGFAGERLVATSTPSLFADDKIAVGEEKSAEVEVRNNGTVALHINPAVLGGANAGDYEIGGSNVEQTIDVGGSVRIPIVFTGSDRGARSATLTVNNNSTNEPVLVVNLGGFVGVRTNAHTPDQISMSSTLLPNGEYEEKQVCIDVENTGDIPMVITGVSLSGAQASQFEVEDETNTTLIPGEHISVCVTYHPDQSAAATATVTITTNGTPGTITVPINGIATSVGDGSVAIAGYELEQSRPHPVVESADLGYSLAAGGIVELSLYDATGRMVRSLVSGAYRSAGSHVERVEVGELESGMYIYRLKVNGYELRSTMVIVK